MVLQVVLPRLGVLVLDVFELSASRFHVLELGLVGLPVPGLSVSGLGVPV